MNRHQAVGDEKTIALSRTKLLLVLAGAMTFVVGGWWMYRAQPGSAFEHMLVDNLTVVHAVGIASMAFFGLVGVFGIRKLFDRSPGLVLREDGLVDNSSAVAAGLIPWRDVLRIDEMKIQRTRLLVIHVSSPERYIERGNAFKRPLNRMNFKLCGSPVVISSNTLQIKFDELMRLCMDYHGRYGVARGR